MASIVVREYKQAAVDFLGRHVDAGVEPAVTSQIVAIDNNSTQSANISDETHLLSVTAEANCYVNFGANVTASNSSDANSTSDFIPANTTKFYGVDPKHRQGGSNLLLAVIALN